MATTAGEPVFVDTNVLVFANVAESPQHKAATSRLAALYEDGSHLCISTQVIREYLVTLSRPTSFKHPPSMKTLIQMIQRFFLSFRVLDETTATSRILLDLLDKVPVLGKQIHDANIVATMKTHDIHYLLTDNTVDFKRFSSYVTVLPLSR
jgi:predicted nucleic acid-binding protein